jgi:hypothetical protein
VVPQPQREYGVPPLPRPRSGWSMVAADPARAVLRSRHLLKLLSRAKSEPNGAPTHSTPFPLVSKPISSSHRTISKIITKALPAKYPMSASFQSGMAVLAATLPGVRTFLLIITIVGGLLALVAAG